MTKEEVVAYVRDEGLWYSIEYGLGSEEIEYDSELKEKWKQASKLLEEIRKQFPEDVI